MTQEEKDLLLQDGVIIETLFSIEKDAIGYVVNAIHTGTSADILSTRLENCKPFLRPMSSMTKEEKKEMTKGSLLAFKAASNDDIKGYCPETLAYSAFNVDYCLSHHFDFHGLIERGLALEAKEDTYIKTKEE